MPIFDNELIDNTRGDGSLEGPEPILGSFAGTKLNMNAGGALYAPTIDRGFSLEELRQIKGTPPEKGFAQTFSSAQKSELLANKRYPVYERGVDLENIYGLQQPWYKQLGNGVAKLGGNLVGTFAQSLTNIPNTIAAAKDTDITKLSGDPNGYEGTIDNWMRNLDDVLPNYMTRYERDHPFLTAIPFTRGSANWWGGKFLPNLGFMGGAVLGAATQDVAIGAITQGIGEIPLIASQIGKASLYLNKLFSGTNAAERVAQLARGLGKTEEQILKMSKLAELSAAAKVGSGFRYGMAIYGSAMTEAGVESRDAYRQVKEELTKRYVAENGKEPDFASAQEIENYATNAMNTRFGINMALLTASNTLQFGNLFKSMTSARGAVQQLEGVGKIGLAEGSLDVFEKKAATTVAGKVWESLKPGVGNIFREGVFEEGGQFAAERGTYDYFTRKYKSDKYNSTWKDLDEVIKSTTFGMKEQFGSQEGIENMLIGGLTGLLVGKVQNLYEKKKGIGDDAKLASALNIVNRFGITNTLQRQYDSTVTQAGIAKDMQEAAKSGDVFKYKNLQEDAFFDFVSYRLPSGMHDVTIMQLEMLKDLPKEQFEQMFQLDFNETNKATVNQYVDVLIDRANDIKKSTDAINSVFRNPFKNSPKEGDVESQIEADNHNTFENYKLDLAYYASIAPNVNRRINSIQQDVNGIVPGVSTSMLGNLMSEDGLKELSDMYEQKANQLNSTVTEFTSVQDRIKIKNQVKALRTRSERIAMALGDGKMTDKLFQDLLNFEINFQDDTKDNVVPVEQVQKLREYGVDVNRLNSRKGVASEAYDKLTTKEGFEKYVEQAEQMAADKEAVAEEEETKPEEKPVEEKKEPVYKNKAGVEEKLEKNREYQIPKAKVASVKKIADDRWQVSYPGGTTSFYKTQEDAKLAADDINTELGNLQKVKILDFNEDGSVKVENLIGDIFNILPSRLTGYERLETKEEKFSKAAGDINRQQEELEKKSGDIGVGEQTNVEVPPVSVSTGPEGKLKTASRFFSSSTGPSEAREDISQAGPHLIRSRVFLNNAKNFKNRNKLRAFLVAPNQISALGLDGLLQMQYNVPLNTPLSEIPNLDNVDLGMVAQVFAEEDGGKLYFVDEKGERISEVNGQPTDMNRIVFKPMPTTSLYYNFKDQNGNVVPKYRAGEKEAFEIYSKRWRASREQLFKAPAFPIKLYKFNISRGEPIEIKINGEIQKNHVGDILIPENKIATQEGVIVIPKEPFISHQGDNIGWPKGSPAFQYGDTLVFLNNTRFSASKAKSIYQVFKALADDVMKQYEADKGIKLNPAYISYLQNVLFYLRKGGTTKEESNQFFIDTANMSIFFGGETYKLDEIGDNETKMVEQLKNTFHNLNSFTLKDNFYSPFYEYVYEDGALKEVEWVNYQSYLLSAKSPDGKSRGINETPFFSNVAPATPAVPYSFQQKYATMIDYDFPMVEAPVTPAATQPTAPGVTKIGDYLMDNETVHTYPSQLGPIEFTGTVEKIDGKDVINVTVKENDTIKKIAKDAEFVENTVVPTLKGIVIEGKSVFDPSDDDLTLVRKWTEYRMIGQLNEILEKQKAAVPTTPAPQAATFTPTTAYGTPVGEPLTTAVTPTAPVSDEFAVGDKVKINTEKDGESVIKEDRGDKVLLEDGRQVAKKNLIKLTPPKAPEPPTKGFDVNDALPPDNYMRVGVNEDEVPMTDAEFELFKKWHAEKTPGIPFEVLDNIVITHDNEKSFGVFENGVAKFHKLAPATAPYHEVGEGIWKAFLTPEQRQLLIDEFKSKSGKFVDRASRKEIYYADATDQQAKERILDDYAEFRAGKIKAKSLGQRVLAFFRSILEFFKQFVQKPSMKEQLFKAIEAGKFKEAKVPERVRKDAPEYMRIPGLTEKQAYNFVQDMVIRSGRILFGGSKKFIYKLNALTGKEVFDKIEQAYIRENKRQQLSDVTWNMLKKRTIDSLRTIGINYNEEDLVNINAEGTTGLGYAPEPFSVNWKKYSPFPIKFLAFSTLKAEPTNQQGSKPMDVPKPQISTDVKGLVMTGYGKVMSTLFNKLSNTTDPKLMGKKLSELARYDADFVRFFQSIGGNLDTGEVDFSEFKDADWRLFIQFFQTFSLQKPEAYIQYVTGSQVYTRPANQFTAAKDIEYGWYEGIKTLSKDKSSLVVYNGTDKVYEIKPDKFPDRIPKEPEDQTEFLKKLGITFTMGDYSNLNDSDQGKFSDAVGGIYTYLKEKKKIGKITGAEMGINSQISTLANLLINSTNPIQESTYPGVDGERLQSFAQNNYFSVFENEFNGAETLEDLLVVRPELKDIFSRNSVVLMNNGLFYKSDGTKMKLIKVSYIQGERDNATSVGKKTSNLTLGTRMTQEINQNLNGNYYILLPADSATEWMLNLGNYIKFEDISSGRAWNRLYKVFKGYLIDDINLALDWENRSKLRNVGDKAKELRFFKDILSTYDAAGNLVPSAILTEINRRIEEGQSIDQITEYISGEEVANEINEMVKTAVEENVERTREALVSESQIITLPKANQEAADVYSYPKLDNDFVNNRNVSLNKFKLSNEDVNNVLTFARMNYMIANIEFHKIIFGDPYQFKVKGEVYDVLKRAKSFGSPRRTTFDIAEYNAELNDTENKVGDVVLDPEEIGYHLYKDYARTVTFADVEFSTENYPEVNEADADSWLMDAAYKELKLKNGQWPEEAEEFHQWQMAYTRQNMPGYQYKSEALRKLDIERLKKPEPVFVIEKLKPVVTGSKAGSTNINLVLDKFAQLPIYYKAVQGTNLEKLYIKMWKEKADYGIMVSGRKLGAEKLQSLYKNNKFNEEPFNNFIDVPWSALGIQVENSFEHEKDQTWGSQPSKISSMDMFDNGGEAMPGAKKAYDKYIDALKRYHINKSKQLLKKLGLEDLGDGFNLSDPISIAETLENEFFRRQLSENVKYAIQLDDNKQFNIPFEASTDYTKIKQILYSLVNKSLISPKLNGGPKPLSSVTLWEKGDRDPKAANPELKFYTKDSPYIEILLPYKYRNKFSKKRFPTDESVLEYLNNTDEGKMLKGIAFRIPCDAQNKIDTYKIKGFLPQFMDAVIGPSELVPKSGTDFDFDKENIYLKSVYVDRNGDVKMVRYLGSEEATKEFFGKLFDDRLEKKKVSKAEILDALQILDLGLDDPNNLVDRYSELLDILLEDATPEDRADTLLKELEKLGDTNFQASLKEKYVEDMYNRALENDFFQAMEDMLTLPGNLERMLVPTNDAGLKEESEEINRLRGIGKKSLKNRILDGAFMTASRHFFSIGKKWVGIVATNITSHAQFQKTQVTLDPIKIDQLSDFEKKIIGDGSVVLPHNTVKVNGQDRLSLSGTKTADGKNRYISERLAGYGTAVVDIVKDPFITDIIYSDLLISPVMFLERIGSGEYVSKFINQPIIRKYISIIESKGERGLFAQRNLDDVAQFFPTKGVTLRDVQIDVNNLDKNIELYAEGKLTNEQNAEQHKILGEFLKYAKMAQYSFKLTQAINYDTSKFRNSDAFSRKQTKTGIAQQKNIFCCAEDVLKATFIENQRDLLDYVMSGMGAIMKTEKDEFRIITDSVLRPYEEVDYMDDEDFERIASKLKASFIDYILQTKMKINEDLAKLTLGSTSVANQLEEARKKYPNLMILNDLQVTSSDREGGAQTVRLRTKITDPVDINIYTERMRELNDADPELFKNIIKLSIIQGTYDSRISIRNIIPAESYSEMVKPIIDVLAPTLDIQQFSNGSFQKNNWKDDSVVPVANIKFFEDENIPPSYDQYDNEYYTYRSPSFEAVPELGITNKFDRRIMLLSPRFNSSDIQYDFLKVRRITTINNKTGEKIDFETGSDISDAAIMNRRNAGDTTVDDVYVYRKVKDAIGNDVTTSDGKYVYKLTNVWGDGEFATEHYSYDRRSIYNNGSIQLDNEIPDEDIIKLYGGVLKAEEEVVPSQTGITTPSGKLTLRDGKEYLISDINAELLESIGYKPKEIGKLLKSIC